MPTPDIQHPDQLPAWDLAAAMRAVGDDEALARSLLEQFRGELPAELAAMRQCAEHRDLAGLAEQAHRCAGGAAYCGVPALSAALHRLEQAARRDDPTASDDALAVLAAQVERLNRIDD